MPKLYSSIRILKVLEKNGFEIVHQKGSHLKLKNPESKKMTIVPANKKEIPIGTFRAILLQTGLEECLFMKKKG